MRESMMVELDTRVYQLVAEFALDCDRSFETALTSSVLNGLTMSLGRGLRRGETQAYDLMDRVEEMIAAYCLEKNLGSHLSYVESGD